MEQKLAKGSKYILIQFFTQKTQKIALGLAQCNPFGQLIDPMLFLLITERLMQRIFILFFFWRVEKLSIFTTLLVLTLPRQYAQALHTTRYSYLCQFFIHIC